MGPGLKVLNKVHFVIEPAHEHLAYVPHTRTYCLVSPGRIILFGLSGPHYKFGYFGRTHIVWSLRAVLHKFGPPSGWIKYTVLFKKCERAADSQGSIITLMN